MKTQLLLGFDSGTQSVKSLLFDVDGSVVGEGHSRHSIETPRPGWVEQDPEGWWGGFIKSLRGALRQAGTSAEEVASIGMSHQRSTMCVVDESGKPLAPAQVWYDARAVDQVREVERLIGAEGYMRITGRMPNTNVMAVKAMWVRDNRPEAFRRSHKLLTVGGYFIHKLTGEFAESYASPTGLLDMESCSYSDEVLTALELPREKLCDLHKPGEVVGYVTPRAAREMGLPEGLPVAAGAGDQQACGLGCGVIEPGRAYLNLGTSVVLGTLSPKYVWGRKFIVREGILPRTWNLEALLNGGFWMVEWFKENFGARSTNTGLTPEQALDDEASKVPAGSLGLIVQPYWLGVGQPYWDVYARGTAIGWSRSHTRAHFYRAVIEGIAYDVRLNLEGMEESVGAKISDVRLCGGGARSSLSCRVITDMLGVPTRRAHTPEATALGAAILAAVSVGVYKDAYDAARAMVDVTEGREPDADNHETYNGLYREVYRELYPTVRGIMRSIGEQGPGNRRSVE